MTLELPHDLEAWLQDEVAQGHFPSTDHAIIEAVRHLARDRQRGLEGPNPPVRPGPEIQEVIDALKDFARGNTLGAGLTIRDMIEESRRS